MSSRKGKDDYLVGILTALPIERAAVRAMFDEEHPTPFDFRRHPLDLNSYTWGAIARHNVVLTSLPAGVYGTTSAATTILPMKYAFPQIKWGLMVGIAAGIPSEERDIRLGDVVVSQPKDNSGGVFQYDFGKVKDNDDWQSVGWLARPPEMLLRALANLQSEHEFRGLSQAQQHLYDAIARHHDWGKRYGFPQGEIDRLFLASHLHQKAFQGCAACDTSKVIKRFERDSSNFQIHYGVIASGNSLVKDAHFRDRIARRMDQCICLEMEAAGMMNDFPCLIIRGICDYADSHKNDNWQRYASATAAAFAKELLGFMSETESRNEEHSVRTKIQATTDNVKITNQVDATTSSTVTNGPAVRVTSGMESMQNLRYESPRTFRVISHTENHGRKEEAHEIDSTSATSTLTTDTQDFVTKSALFARVEEALGDSSDIDKKIDFHDHTLLSQAAQDGDYDMAEFLLDRGANVHTTSRLQQTPLHYSASYGYVEVVRLLLDRKADLEAVAPGGPTALHLAARDGHVGVVRLLLDRGANLKAVSIRKWTALHLAAEHGHAEVAGLLLDRGANLKAVTIKKWTALHLAAKYGHVEVVGLLLDRGANLGAVTTEEWTALHFAAKNGHVEVVRLLLDQKANLEAVGPGGATALHLAAGDGHVEVVRLLLDRKASLEAVITGGWTALHLAARDGHMEVVKSLIEAGANPPVRTNRSDHPSELAKNRGHDKVVKPLKEHGADPCFFK